ncbi:MAG: NUDIX hydrolase [Pseudomonadota bacterium]
MARKYSDYPILGVGGAVFLDDKVVLVKRGKEPGYGRWSIPGGAVKLGETMEEAVKREVYEETDLDVDVLEVVKVVDPIIRDESNRIAYHYVLVDFLCRYKSGKLRPNSDVLDARAVPMSELSAYDLPDVTLEVIQKAADLLKKRVG